MGMEKTDRQAASTGNVRAVTRAVDILRSFRGQPRQSLAEVASAAELDKGTTRRLLLTLMKSGLVVQDPVSQRYGLGRLIRELAASVNDDFDLRSVAVPELTAIANELHLTTFLSVYRNHTALCLERIHDMQGMEVHWWPVGGTLPLNSGGAPKLLLAHQPESEIDQVLSEPLRPVTPQAMTDPVAFRAHLAEIRERGWEYAEDDVTLGLAALAVPVVNPDGKIICALSMAGLSPQMRGEREPRYLGRLLQAARRVSAGLGY